MSAPSFSCLWHPAFANRGHPLSLVRSIVDGPEVPHGPGAVVTGRFVTRQAADLVRVTFEDGTQLTGTRNHPVWSPVDGDWRGLGDFLPGMSVSTREGFAIVASVESLPETAPVYNIEVAGEHVYQVTDLGVLVHNALAWNCDVFLSLRQKFLNKDVTPMSAADRELYDEYAHILKDRFRQFMDPEDIKELNEMKPLPDGDGVQHLHHILQKLINNKKTAQDILDVQVKLWKEGIDPFVGMEIFVWARNIKGQHGEAAMRPVLKALNDAFDAGKNREEIIGILRELGDEAAKRGN